MIDYLGDIAVILESLDLGPDASPDRNIDILADGAEAAPHPACRAEEQADAIGDLLGVLRILDVCSGRYLQERDAEPGEIVDVASLLPPDDLCRLPLQAEGGDADFAFCGLDGAVPGDQCGALECRGVAAVNYCLAHHLDAVNDLHAEQLRHLQGCLQRLLADGMRRLLVQLHQAGGIMVALVDELLCLLHLMGSGDVHLPGLACYCTEPPPHGEIRLAVRDDGRAAAEELPPLQLLVDLQAAAEAERCIILAFFFSIIHRKNALSSVRSVISPRRFFPMSNFASSTG